MADKELKPDLATGLPSYNPGKLVNGRILYQGDTNLIVNPLDKLGDLCTNLTIISSAIHDITWHADGSVTEINITGDENVRLYLEKVKNAIDKAPPSDDKHAFIDETGKITPINYEE